MIYRRSIPHDEGRHVALPLGGIGTGNVALAADGALRQWQLHNIGNHRGELPGSFFALRVTQWEPPFNEVHVLQAPPPPDDAPSTPLVNDDLVPTWQRELLEEHQGVRGTTFSGTYPFANIDYDADLPVTVSLEAFTPFAPLDLETSALPVAMFTFTLTNTDDIPVHGWIGAGLQNAVGADGTRPPDGVRDPGYGGNVNRVLREDGWTNLIMENPSLPQGHPGAGQMVLTTDAGYTTALAQWTAPHQFLDFIRSRQPFAPHDWAHMPPTMADPQPTGSWVEAGASPAGSTWNGGLAAQFNLEPGESTQVRFAIAWHFPNRYMNFTQFGGIQQEWGPTRFWLGNHYTTRFPDAAAVARTVGQRWQELRGVSWDWARTLAGSDLTDAQVEHFAAQGAIVRSPSYFHTADGHFFGFEGVQGASTVMWSGDVGGSCPLNCTHVYNYAQGTARLFPQIERDMRECEYDVMQSPDGFIPHRVISPTYLPQIWDRDIGGPGEPALDGMLGSVLKSYREVLAGAGMDWLTTYWPNIDRLMTYVEDTWDPHGSGMLHGIQPSTHDIDLSGLNTFMGTYWLAALRAAEEMARLLGHTERADQFARAFTKGSRAYDEALFNGEYYVQVLEEGDPKEFQWESGCLSDQLIGQWWAHVLGLGHLLPEEHVRSALRAVVTHNLRRGFEDFHNPYRVFADGQDTGLLMCTWPDGGRPEIPTRYCDEVWTGIEQQVAAHCIYEGLHEEAEQILHGLWERYDGRRRNPYNQIECGDHYVRALAGWSAFDALTGQSWNAVTSTLTVNGLEEATTLPVLTHTGWGTISREGEEIVLTCTFGDFDISRLDVGGAGAQQRIRLTRGESKIITTMERR